MVFWFAMRNYQMTLDALRAAGWTVNPVPALWVKPSGNSQVPSRILGSQYENFFYCSKGKAVLGKPGMNNVLHYKTPRIRVHPTQKTVSMLSYILELFTNGPGRVLDPFMGSGSMAIAAIIAKYRYTGYEISKDMTDLARKFVLDYVVRGITDETPSS
jgi:DNA modification methylase